MLVSMADVNLQPPVVRQHIETIEIILQQNRMPDGTRKMTNISEFHGYDQEGRPIIKDIYRFEIVEAARQEERTRKVHTIGYFHATGFQPLCKDRLMLHLRTEMSREEAEAFWDYLLDPDQRAWVNGEHLTEQEKIEYGYL
jgi:hypothetical protein